LIRNAKAEKLLLMLQSILSVLIFAIAYNKRCSGTFVGAALGLTIGIYGLLASNYIETGKILKGPSEMSETVFSVKSMSIVLCLLILALLFLFLELHPAMLASLNFFGFFGYSYGLCQHLYLYKNKSPSELPAPKGTGVTALMEVSNSHCHSSLPLRTERSGDIRSKTGESGNSTKFIDGPDPSFDVDDYIRFLKILVLARNGTLILLMYAVVMLVLGKAGFTEYFFFGSEVNSITITAFIAIQALFFQILLRPRRKNLS